MGTRVQFANQHSLAVRKAAIVRKLRSAARSPAFVKLWVLPAWGLIGLASLAIVILPFRRIAPWLGHNLGTAAVTPHPPRAAVERAAQIAMTIAIAAKYAPFRSDCLPQAMVAAALCRLYSIPYALHLGCKINPAGVDGSPMAAHAWVVTGPIVLSGGRQSAHGYCSLTCWTMPRPAQPISHDSAARVDRNP